MGYVRQPVASENLKNSLQEIPNYFVSYIPNAACRECRWKQCDQMLK